jgi:hypothetical protein
VKQPIGVLLRLIGFSRSEAATQTVRPLDAKENVLVRRTGRIVAQLVAQLGKDRYINRNERAAHHASWHYAKKWRRK